MTSKLTIAAALVGVFLGAFELTPLTAQTANPPPAYVVVEFMVKEPDLFKDYAQRAPATVRQYGGRVLVGGGKVERVKGDEPRQGPVVILAFDSADQVKKWASSPEYSELVPIRDKAADSRIFIVEGVSPAH